MRRTTTWWGRDAGSGGRGAGTSRAQRPRALPRAGRRGCALRGGRGPPGPALRSGSASTGRYSAGGGADRAGPGPGARFGVRLRNCAAWARRTAAPERRGAPVLNLCLLWRRAARSSNCREPDWLCGVLTSGLMLSFYGWKGNSSRRPLAVSDRQTDLSRKKKKKKRECDGIYAKGSPLLKALFCYGETKTKQKKPSDIVRRLIN